MRASPTSWLDDQCVICASEAQWRDGYLVREELFRALFSKKQHLDAHDRVNKATVIASGEFR